MNAFRRALLRWIGEPEPAGPEALFADSRLDVTPLDPAEVGRQERFGAAILDTAAWLDANGWAGVCAGDRQVYAAWLLAARAAYERQEVMSR